MENLESFYSILVPFVDNYFKERDYSINDFPVLKAKEIKDISLVYVEYSAKNKIIKIINSQNESQVICIDLINKTISGFIEYEFTCNTHINYFDNIDEYIYQTELINNLLTYTSLGIYGEVKGLNKFSIYFKSSESEPNATMYNNINMPISYLFENRIEFITLFNTARNSNIFEEERFVWAINAAANLKKASKNQYNLIFVVSNLKITDKLVESVKHLDTGNIKAISFNNCKFNLTNDSNIQFIKSISDNMKG